MCMFARDKGEKSSNVRMVRFESLEGGAKGDDERLIVRNELACEVDVRECS
jgi:hypothetical protein